MIRYDGDRVLWWPDEPVPGFRGGKVPPKVLGPEWKDVGYTTEEPSMDSVMVAGDGTVDGPLLALPTLTLKADAAKMIREMDCYSFPQRYMTGISPAEFPRHHLTTFAQQKETTMTDIDQTEFAPRTKAQKVKAERLGFIHLNQLVTVTLPSGAEVTDILTAVSSGYGHSRGLNLVTVRLANVHLQSDFGPTGFELEPDSVVLVRKRRAS